MPDEGRKPDDVEKLLTEQKTLEERKQAMIQGLLKEREDMNAAIDEKLKKLGYRANTHSAKGKRSHHKKAAKPAAPAPTPSAGQRPARPSDRPRGSQEPSRSRQGE
jgi:hypothetical protein